ncbi:uncharacterized protein LAESUDRAFT_725933 [Laetiporus sulphureus 93-53]|uniref:Thioesterase domain-containing protein n=1 Tax=Laetiporus sulphureus 93-53 TaxID=1314785 RepID=A0A165E8V0_9APHY|nr:uncharacterized protein LAESUDRAFT_725933 [Laetiporus sulphureus 93-53]KZT06486.1 hypothetical protein LAESUDRAFT_725933 [Laetiporus sulphureus 93-53]
MTFDARIQFWSQILHDADGNVSPQLVTTVSAKLPSRSTRENTRASLSLSAKELSPFERSEDGTLHVRVVFEIVVKEDMLSGYKTVHGGCIAYLIDMYIHLATVYIGINVLLIIQMLLGCPRITFPSEQVVLYRSKMLSVL